MASIASKRRMLKEKKKLIFKYLDKWKGKTEITSYMISQQFKLAKSKASSIITEWEKNHSE